MRFTPPCLPSISHTYSRSRFDPFRSLNVILLEGNSFLGNPIGHLLVHIIGLPGLCLNRSSLDPYDPHIMLMWRFPQ